MIKRINSIEYAYLKSIKQQNEKILFQQRIITEGWFGNLCKIGANAFNSVKNFVADSVAAVGKWFKGLWGLIKYGVKVLINATDGTYKKDTQKYANDSSELQNNLYIVLPFMKKPMDVINEAGQDTHKHQFKDLKTSLKGQKKQSNVDSKAKKIGSGLWSKAKDKFISAVSGSTAEAKQMGKQMKKENAEGKQEQNKEQTNKNNNSEKQNKKENKQQKQKTDTNNNQTQDQNNIKSENNRSKLTNDDMKIINEEADKYIHELHDLVVDWVYKGVTPKIIMEAIDNEHTNTPQGNIILEGNLMSFKTYNGELICEERNLKTNDIIIYESNCKFKGSHLIFEETENRFRKFKHVITQQENSEYQDIITEGIDLFMIISILSICMTIVGLITLIKHVLLAPLHAATCGVSAAAAQGTKPVQAAGGTVAGNATVTGTQEIGKATLKETLKQTAKAVHDQGIKTVAKATAKEIGKQAIAHPMQAVSNARLISRTANDIGDTVDTVKNAMDGGAGAIADAMSKEQSVDIGSADFGGNNELKNINFNL